jgi:hypothetical protein
MWEWPVEARAHHFFQSLDFVVNTLLRARQMPLRERFSPDEEVELSQQVACIDPLPPGAQQRLGVGLRHLDRAVGRHRTVDPGK